MNSAVITLTFASRWPNMPLWGVVVLHTTHGGCRAEYVPSSERQNGSHWSYDFYIQANDVPPPLTLADINNSVIVSPFVTPLSPCEPVLSNCFAAIPDLPEGTPADMLAVVVGPDACGKWCVYKTTAADHDPYWTP